MEWKFKKFLYNVAVLLWKKSSWIFKQPFAFLVQSVHCTTIRSCLWFTESYRVSNFFDNPVYDQTIGTLKGVHPFDHRGSLFCTTVEEHTHVGWLLDDKCVHFQQGLKKMVVDKEECKQYNNLKKFFANIEVPADLTFDTVDSFCVWISDDKQKKFWQLEPRGLICSRYGEKEMPRVMTKNMKKRLARKKTGWKNCIWHSTRTNTTTHNKWTEVDVET